MIRSNYTVTAHKGGQYRLLLPDGSAIRLNAGTSVRFPKAFRSGNRSVELNGEGLFDVAAGGGPFVVKPTYATVRTVQGRFNIRAYAGGTIVTPLGGHLQAWHSNRSLQLPIGDQLVLSPAGPYHEHYTAQQSNADTAQVVSWARAQHYFTDIKLKEFVEDVGRQYNLELRRLGCIPDQRVSVTLCYNKPLDEVLAFLRKKGLICVLQGNILTFCEPMQIKQLAAKTTAGKNDPL